MFHWFVFPKNCSNCFYGVHEVSISKQTFYNNNSLVQWPCCFTENWKCQPIIIFYFNKLINFILQIVPFPRKLTSQNLNFKTQPFRTLIFWSLMTGRFWLTTNSNPRGDETSFTVRAVRGTRSRSPDFSCGGKTLLAILPDFFALWKIKLTFLSTFQKKFVQKNTKNHIIYSKPSQIFLKLLENIFDWLNGFTSSEETFSIN